MRQILHIRNAMGYIVAMTNTAAAGNDPEYIRTQIAGNLRAELSRQRWSARSAAIALGLTHVYISRRVRGDVELSGSDIIVFSEFLNVPTSVLLDLDSNQEPIGFESEIVNLADYQRTKQAAHTAVASDRDAKVTQFPHAAGH